MERAFWLGSSVAAATTVPARMGVLSVPEFGPPAQDLVGAVLPTATGHAGGRVIDFESVGQEDKVGCRELTASLPGLMRPPSCKGAEGGQGPSQRTLPHHPASLQPPRPLDWELRRPDEWGLGPGERHWAGPSCT